MAVTIFNPDANPETTSVDGTVDRGGVNETFGTIRGGAGTSSSDTVGSGSGVPRLSATTTTDQYSLLTRGIYLFDTSSLGAGAIISAATFSLYIDGASNAFSAALNVTSSAPASNTALVSGDYAVAGFGGTDFATDITIASLTINQYTDWTLNATGIAAISLTGITKFACRFTHDIDNTAPTWSSGADAFITPHFADGTNKPKLTVTYTPLAGGEISYAYFM